MTGAHQGGARSLELSIATDVLVLGGGLGGVAAALSVARSGAAAVLVESTDWLGGQLTVQAVPPDEHPWIERFGRTETYAELRRAIRRHYRTWYPLDRRAARDPYLNPGRGWVSRLCHEPRVAVAVIDGLLAPHELSGRITILRETRLAGVDVAADRVRSVRLLSADGRLIEVAARFVLDATETGEFLPLAGVEYVSGSESRNDTGEPHASDRADPRNMQAVTCCMAVEHAAGEDHTIDRPASYDRWRGFVPVGWPGPLLSWTAPNPQTLEPVTYPFLVDGGDAQAAERSSADSPGRGSRNLWTYRRIAARSTFAAGTLPHEVTIVNWPQTDYTAGPIFEVDGADAQAADAGARSLTLSVLYWLQTEALRPDGGQGWPGLRLRPDITGTHDGLAKGPYVREARRIRALRTVTELDVGTSTGPDVQREPDSIGVGYYRIDLHPSTGGDPYIDVPSRPFEIPLGALVPIRIENVLAAGKTIGATHVANGCLRMHPTEWNIGEVAGLLAAFCCARGTIPQAVSRPGHERESFLRAVEVAGVQRRWPDGVRAPGSER